MVMLAAALSAAAQATTSSISGAVSDAAGNKLQGAAVVARHEPSGSEYGVYTDRNGYFNIQGMRTGGPYTVEISYIGYRSVVVNDIVLELGNTFELDSSLEPSTDLDP